MKNWKSFVAFFLFIAIYAYTTFGDKSEAVIWNTGLIALIAFLAVMSRSDMGAKLVDSLIEIIKLKMK